MLLWVLYGLTALTALSAGLICWRGHSTYPNTDTGYRFGRATDGEAQWNYANKAFGKLSVFGGIACFLIIPGLLAYLDAPFAWRLGAYGALVAAWGALVFFLPQWLLRRRA